MLRTARQEVPLLQLRSRGFSLSCALFLLLPAAGCGGDETLDPGLPSRVLDAGDETGDESETPGRPTPPSPPTDPPSATGPSPFGTACLRDGQCAQGLTCITNDDDRFLGGGVANGYCAMACETDAECTERDPGSFCLGVSATEAFCVQGCQPGVDSASKCHGRGDMACDARTLDVAFCRPVCRSDDDCGGRSCDLGFGICLDEALPGVPIGAECDPNAQESECASGLCLEFTEDFAACSGWCNVSEYGCGPNSPSMETPGDPMCVWGANLSGQVTAGDLGWCNQRCDCDGDCLHPDAKCLLVEEELRAVFGARGLCVAPDWEVQGDEVLGAACSERDAGVPDDASVPDAGDGGGAVDAAGPEAGADEREDLDAAPAPDAALAPDAARDR